MSDFTDEQIAAIVNAIPGDVPSEDVFVRMALEEAIAQKIVILPPAPLTDEQLVAIKERADEALSTAFRCGYPELQLARDVHVLLERLRPVEDGIDHEACSQGCPDPASHYKRLWLDALGKIERLSAAPNDGEQHWRESFALLEKERDYWKARAAPSRLPSREQQLRLQQIRDDLQYGWTQLWTRRDVEMLVSLIADPERTPRGIVVTNEIIERAIEEYNDFAEMNTQAVNMRAAIETALHLLGFEVRP